MSLLGFCEWLRETAASTAIRESLYFYPLLHWWHILSIAVMFGSIVFLDLRLIGAGFRKRRVTEIAGPLLLWTWTGYILMAVSGGLIFLSDPVRYYESTLFRIKFLLMLLAGVNALVFHYTVYRSVATWDLEPPPARARLVGAVSMTVWVAVIATGRAVGYFS